ncbi:hypothetical protein J437_LFUL016279 [Ladona fulva]|uniref:Uncharacterized protein n=1 Tax=Ladona fulva TaxID=123851 RepID=A0A8K0KR50_LADFU|nr:hypothetical protein J437_LFUL016279 [Ladona fulva]
MDHPNNNHGLLRGKAYGEHSTRMIKRQIPMAQNPSDYANQAKEAVSEQMENFNRGVNFFTGNGKMSPPPVQSSLL